LQSTQRRPLFLPRVTLFSQSFISSTLGTWHMLGMLLVHPPWAYISASSRNTKLSTSGSLLTAATCSAFYSRDRPWIASWPLYCPAFRVALWHCLATPHGSALADVAQPEALESLCLNFFYKCSAIIVARTEVHTCGRYRVSNEVPKARSFTCFRGVARLDCGPLDIGF